MLFIERSQTASDVAKSSPRTRGTRRHCQIGPMSVAEYLDSTRVFDPRLDCVFDLSWTGIQARWGICHATAAAPIDYESLLLFAHHRPAGLSGRLAVTDFRLSQHGTHPIFGSGLRRHVLLTGGGGTVSQPGIRHSTRVIIEAARGMSRPLTGAVDAY